MLDWSGLKPIASVNILDGDSVNRVVCELECSDFAFGQHHPCCAQAILSLEANLPLNHGQPQNAAVRILLTWMKVMRVRLAKLPMGLCVDVGSKWDQ